MNSIFVGTYTINFLNGNCKTTRCLLEFPARGLEGALNCRRTAFIGSYCRQGCAVIKAAIMVWLSPPASPPEAVRQDHDDQGLPAWGGSHVQQYLLAFRLISVDGKQLQR